MLIEGCVCVCAYFWSLRIFCSIVISESELMSLRYMSFKISPKLLSGPRVFGIAFVLTPVNLWNISALIAYA